MYVNHMKQICTTILSFIDCCKHLHAGTIDSSNPSVYVRSVSSNVWVALPTSLVPLSPTSSSSTFSSSSFFNFACYASASASSCFQGQETESAEQQETRGC